MTAGGGKGGGQGLDPNLAAILESIRASVSGAAPAPGTEAAEDAPAQPVAPPLPPQPAPRPLRANLPPSDKTVEEFLADLIRPQVEAWLAAHLPEIVQKLAADEIRRLTGGK